MRLGRISPQRLDRSAGRLGILVRDRRVNPDLVFLYFTVFEDVDVVRYPIGGKFTQVNYSAREMDVRRLVSAAQTWQNRQLVYTYGFGCSRHLDRQLRAPAAVTISTTRRAPARADSASVFR